MWCSFGHSKGVSEDLLKVESNGNKDHIKVWKGLQGMTAEAGTLKSGKAKTECYMAEKHEFLNTRNREHVVNLADARVKINKSGNLSHVNSYVTELFALKGAIQVGLEKVPARCHEGEIHHGPSNCETITSASRSLNSKLLEVVPQRNPYVLSCSYSLPRVHAVGAQQTYHG